MMLLTKFQGHQPTGSGKEDYFSFLPYMGVAATLVRLNNFSFPQPLETTLRNLVTKDRVVSEEKSFEIVV